MTARPKGSRTGRAAGGLDERIEAFIERGADGASGRNAAIEEAEFDRLALELFAFQYEHNAPYRRFCRTRRAEPGRLTGWTQIPPMPLGGFKELTLACEPPEEAAAVFTTSGSTDPSRRGRNYHPHLRLYDVSLRVNFAHHFLPDRDRMRLLVLNARPQGQPESSLAYFLGRLVDSFGADGSDFFVGPDGLQLRRLEGALREAESGEPVALLGTSFAYVHLLDAFAEHGMSFDLPAGSRLLDTGGFKGRSREVSADDLRAQLSERLGIGEPWCVNYYGMTEISSQYYDNSLRDAWLGRRGQPRQKMAPAWTRIQVVDPESGAPVEPGHRGLVVHYDLANRGSCLAVLAEDVGYQVLPEQAPSQGAAGFVLLGRAETAEARGCSIALDEFLGSNGGRPW